jgi:hypothetical protein
MATTKATPASDPTANQLSGAWPLLKESIRIYRERFWVFLGLSMLVIPTLALIAFLVFAVSFLGLSNIAVIGLGVILVVLAVAISYWGQIAGILLVNEGVAKPGFKDLLKRSLPLILPVIWVMILSFLFIMGGLLLLIIPGIILALSFIFGMQAVVLDGDRGIAALQRSRFYVRGRWWKVFWRLLFLVLFVIVVSIPEFILDGLRLAWLSDIYGGITTLLLGPLFVVYSTLLYLELKKTGPEKFVPDPGQRKKYQILGALGAVALVALTLLIASAWGTGTWADPNSPAYEQMDSDFGL